MGDAEASSYDSIARLYDPWSVSVREDVDFYVELARVADGPVVELGVGTGRIAIPIAAQASRSSASTRRAGCSRCARRPRSPASRTSSTSASAT